MPGTYLINAFVPKIAEEYPDEWGFVDYIYDRPFWATTYINVTAITR
jgi:hypothetical protein